MVNIKNVLQREYKREFKSWMNRKGLSESELDIIDISKFNDTDHWSEVVVYKGEELTLPLCELIAFRRRIANKNAGTFEHNLDGQIKNTKYPWRGHELVGVQGEVAFMVWCKKNGVKINDEQIKDFTPRSAKKGEDDDGDFILTHCGKEYAVDVKTTCSLNGTMNCYTAEGSDEVPNKAEIFGNFKFIDGDRFLFNGFAWSRDVLISSNFNHKASFPCFAIEDGQLTDIETLFTNVQK